jgi:cation transport regulator ChaB
MPYRTVSELPPDIRKKPATVQRQFMHVFNSVYAKAKKDGKSDKEAEQAAFEQARGVIKKRMGWRDTMPLKLFAGKKTKTEGGVAFPAAAYAYVGDPNSPETWKVRLWETPSTKETAKQVGMAVAAVGTGFRGNKAAIPAAAMASVKRKVRAAWKRVNPGKSSDEMPDAIKMSVNFSVTDEETGTVYHWGKIFEPGTYADKGFSLTVEEMDAAIEAPFPA